LLRWAQISGAAYSVWGGPRQERRSAPPPQLWLEADRFPGMVNLGPSNLCPSCPPLHGCVPGELPEWPGGVGRGSARASATGLAGRATGGALRGVCSPLPPYPPLQLADWAECRHSHKSPGLDFSVASRAAPAGVRCHSTLAVEGQNGNLSSGDGSAISLLEQLRCRQEDREGGERHTPFAARWAASAACREPAAGSRQQQQQAGCSCCLLPQTGWGLVQ